MLIFPNKGVDGEIHDIVVILSHPLIAYSKAYRLSNNLLFSARLQFYYEIYCRKFIFIKGLKCLKLNCDNKTPVKYPFLLPRFLIHDITSCHICLHQI